MILDEAGIADGWQVESMPAVRLMNDLVLMPDGNVLIINGVGTGVSKHLGPSSLCRVLPLTYFIFLFLQMAGFGNVKDQVGQSNSDHPGKYLYS